MVILLLTGLPYVTKYIKRATTFYDLKFCQDSEYYNSLHWILDNDAEVLDLTFSVDEEVLGQVPATKNCTCALVGIIKVSSV